MATRRRRNRVATKAFYDNLTASAHDGQDERVWALSDMSDAAVGFSALVPTSPSASPAPPDQSSASVVVLQDDSLTVVAVAELTDARPGIALSQQVASPTASALPMSAAVSMVVPEPTDVAKEDVESTAPWGSKAAGVCETPETARAFQNRRKRAAKRDKWESAHK